jgi:hypothetical protein
MLLVLVSLGCPQPALAQDSDEPDQDAAAQQHFNKGRELYGAGKYKEAIVELKKAFTLRPAPPILLNIGRTHEKLGDKKGALKSYRRFLLKARLVDPNRKLVKSMVVKLEKELGIKHRDDNSLVAPTAKRTGQRRKKVAELQLIHTPIDAAKVRNDITVQAELPPDLDVDGVFLLYRRGGESKFRKVAMKLQGEGYIAQVPGRHVTSTSLQYFLEARKKGAGKKGVLARAGSKKNPHIIVIEGGRAPHLGPIKHVDIRSPYRTWFWVGVGTTVGMIGGTVAMWMLAADRSNAVENLAKQSCGNGCPPNLPGRSFAERSARDYESQGKMFNVMGAVFLGLGVAAAAGSGVLYYFDREYVRKERARLEARGPPPRKAGVRLFAAPWLNAQGGGFTGRIEF